MVDLRALRQQIRGMDDDDVATVSRRWLEQVAQDLTELQLVRAREHFTVTPPVARAG